MAQGVNQRLMQDALMLVHVDFGDLRGENQDAGIPACQSTAELPAPEKTLFSSTVVPIPGISIRLSSCSHASIRLAPTRPIKQGGPQIERRGIRDSFFDLPRNIVRVDIVDDTDTETLQQYADAASCKSVKSLIFLQGPVHHGGRREQRGRPARPRIAPPSAARPSQRDDSDRTRPLNPGPR